MAYVAHPTHTCFFCPYSHMIYPPSSTPDVPYAIHHQPVDTTASWSVRSCGDVFVSIFRDTRDSSVKMEGVQLQEFIKCDTSYHSCQCPMLWEGEEVVAYLGGGRGVCVLPGRNICLKRRETECLSWWCCVVLSCLMRL